VPVTGSNKIDTVAAELVPRNRRAASVSNSRAGSSVSSGMPLWEAFAGGYLRLLG
jgi:hypothetical protein